MRRGLTVAMAAATLACVTILAACGNASQVAKRGTTGSPTSGTGTVPRVAQDAADVNPEVAACMHRNGITVLSNGELQVSKTTLAPKRKTAEARCGFGVKSVARRRAPTKPAAGKLRNAARQPSAIKAQSFRSRLIAKIVACLHNAGVDIPSSDSTLLSSTSGIKTRIPWIKAAIGRCRGEL